jgi:hypothetical protein
MVLHAQNKRPARLENADIIPTEKELKVLQHTAEVEGIDVPAARNLQNGFRYQL